MKDLFKRIMSLGLRKKKRYKVTKEVYAKLEHAYRKNQIDEISLGGLSFYYVENGYPIGKASRYLKLQAGRFELIETVRFKVASDTYVGESTLPKHRIKRLSLQFDGLSFQQRRRLKKIIHHHTIGPV